MKRLVKFIILFLIFSSVTTSAQNINVNISGTNTNNTFNIGNTYNITNNYKDLAINEESSDLSTLIPVDSGYFANVVYYCNTPIRQAITLNERGQYMAMGVTYNYPKSYDKAKILYQFVSSYITYDMDRSNQIKNRTNLCNLKAGAQYAFDTKSGVCFEFAMLYAAMAHAVGLKVRLVCGESHIWNQFLDTATNRWISVDPTWKLFDFNVNSYHKSYVIHAEF